MIVHLSLFLTHFQNLTWVERVNEVMLVLWTNPTFSLFPPKNVAFQFFLYPFLFSVLIKVKVEKKTCGGAGITSLTIWILSSPYFCLSTSALFITLQIGKEEEEEEKKELEEEEFTFHDSTN